MVSTSERWVVDESTKVIMAPSLEYDVQLDTQFGETTPCCIRQVSVEIRKTGLEHTWNDGVDSTQMTMGKCSTLDPTRYRRKIGTRTQGRDNKETHKLTRGTNGTPSMWRFDRVGDVLFHLLTCFQRQGNFTFGSQSQCSPPYLPSTVALASTTAIGIYQGGIRET